MRPVLVMGGAGGIGRAVAAVLLDRGHPVAIADRAITSQEPPARAGLAVEPAAWLYVDVTTSDSVRACLASAHAALGGALGGLVNCAGMHRPTALAESDDRFARTIVDVNFFGTFYACREAAPYLAEYGDSRIVNIGSDASRAGLAKASVYSSSKGAVNALTRSLAIELAPVGTTVNCVSPGAIETDMLRTAMSVDPEQIKRLERRVPLRRLGSPEDVAATVAHLISDEASYITGQTISVNGGSVVST